MKLRDTLDFMGKVYRVDVPVEMYRDFIPQANVVPLAVDSNETLDKDLRISREIFHEAQKFIDELQRGGRSVSVSLLMGQLLRVLASWRMSGQKHSCILKGEDGKRREIRVTPKMSSALATIQQALSRRLLLFEEMLPASSQKISWTETTSDYVHDRSEHRFKAGNKAAFAVSIAESLVRKHKRVALFVRYRLAAEGLCALLRDRGIASDFLHSGNRINSSALTNFREHRLSALVVTRQLFGRGFDLPEADSAIFFSPKMGERTMWQEALRIRSRVSQTKDVFICYFAWTTESAKWAALRAKISPIGSKPGQPFIWRYGTSHIPAQPSADTAGAGARSSGQWHWPGTDQDPSQSSTSGSQKTSPTGPDAFVRELWDLLEVPRQVPLNVTELVAQLMQNLLPLSNKLAERLAGDLIASLEEMRNQIRNGADTFRLLAKRLHPDCLGQEAGGALFIALKKESDRRKKRKANPAN